MSTSVNGPAAGTRSRTISGKPTKTEVSAQRDPIAHTQQSKGKQRPVSSFFSTIRFESNSDSEVFCNSAKLKKRSASGKIYQTQINFPATSFSKQKKLTTQTMGDQAEQAQQTQQAVSRSVNANLIATSGTTIMSGTTNASIVTSIATGASTQTISATTTIMSPTAVANLNRNLNLQSKNNEQNINVAGIKGNIQINPTHSGVEDSLKMKDSAQKDPSQEIVDNPQQTMMSMLVNITNKLTSMQTDITSLKDTKTELKDQLDGLQFDVEDDRDEIVRQRKELDIYKDKVETLTDILVRYEGKMESLHQRCLTTEAKLLRSELIIFGLQDNKKSCKEIAEKFFSTTMGIDPVPAVKYAYWKGSSKNKPMVVSFTHANAKGAIYSNVSNLKGKKNHLDRAYKIEDHLPEEMMEQSRRAQQIVRANRQLLDGDQQTMKFKNRKLHINDSLYKCKLTPIKVETMLEMDKEVLNTVAQVNTAQSKERIEQGSKFIAYAIGVGSVQQVQNYMVHFRRKHGAAHHVCVAYRLASIDKAYGEDYFDDQEHSMGRRMLDHLIREEIVNKMIVLVRYYGGIHIGQARFDIMYELVKEALDLLDKDVTIKSVLPLRCLLEHKPIRRQRKGRKPPSHLRVHQLSSTENRKQTTQEATPGSTGDDSSQQDFESAVGAEWSSPQRNWADYESDKNGFGTFPPSVEQWGDSPGKGHALWSDQISLHTEGALTT